MLPLRVVQWTTGIVGRSAVRTVLAHPDLELVGCFSWSADKAGRDVGELCGIGPVGVVATDSVEEILGLRPDAVLYMPLHWRVDDMVRLLEAGINVVSTANFITGRSYGDDDMRRLDDAAKRGGVSLYGTGINPGYANALGLMATAVCRRVDRVSVLESVDCTAYASPQTWLETGFAVPPDTPGLAELAKSRQLVFVDAVEMMAEALRVTLDDIVYTPEFGVATEDLDLGYMKIAKGHVCGLKGLWSGRVGGRSVIELGLVWRLGYAMEPDWPIEEGYVIDVDGEPSVHSTFTVRYDTLGVDFGMPTANPAVNAIPHVVVAAPGLVTVDELSMITAAGLAGTGA
ncbi:NAD(P)H-dependent amine dehydrogenase family protein [Pseudofrankia inefficax]|uniref:Dihydrodipicolinate reductase n=1 Tax=Pseudofrankia inefficax (strain DSM 45817 / CECT 9037 / DDB 130130 / EuI1c) TaxID=298654 RepID=E3IVD8_PSEI1|nr:dihydrodipicolinate reductase [Pseudofrankia inefficax]